MIHGYHVLHPKNAIQKLRYDPVSERHARYHSRLGISALQYVLNGKEIPHGGYVAGYGAVSEGDECSRALADEPKIAQVLLVCHGPFDKRNINTRGKLFDVGDRRIADIHDPGQVE